MNVVEKIIKHTLCSVTFYRKPCRLWENVEKYVQPARPQMTIWPKRVAWRVC